jgi:hypothetical protein
MMHGDERFVVPEDRLWLPPLTWACLTMLRRRSNVLGSLRADRHCF